ncbi:nascent polypeptide-associated complex subunit beta [Microbotryum lychnidis-dioicae p1A1 Lamole]|uniref:Nascent polypeptide-associated complex subunit beta n=2 Tax=Microbotryum TaxID=34416 RepID=U5HCZ1_USTV1|nr:nascent polypeptide-associated complex subunit beta [Microbotryum lychnidis-dioicae p1A1 Lamole]SGY74479.1 BQ5605_C005g03365 [Microbotryum silenes-dioicae]|eukprot:KDE04543.1 nascent polypeptide-associated complex subunit beta [Microbotryum lychnidis-dioicae p1A1 Lamole]
MSTFDPEALKKLQDKTAALRLGGKGTVRRKVVAKPRAGGSDQKLQASLKKLNVQHMQGVEEVNMFKADGGVLHFSAPKVHHAIAANTFAIYGQGKDKEITELVPGVLSQLGPDAMANLRRIAESYQASQGQAASMGPNAVVPEADDDDDAVPDLVDTAGEPSIEDIN